MASMSKIGMSREAVSRDEMCPNRCLKELQVIGFTLKMICHVFKSEEVCAKRAQFGSIQKLRNETRRALVF